MLLCLGAIIRLLRYRSPANCECQIYYKHIKSDINLWHFGGMEIKKSYRIVARFIARAFFAQINSHLMVNVLEDLFYCSVWTRRTRFIRFLEFFIFSDFVAPNPNMLKLRFPGPYNNLNLQASDSVKDV